MTAQTDEGRVKTAIDAQLDAVRAYRHKPVQNGMGLPALDYHVSHRGFYAAIEAKSCGGVPTERQTRTMRNVVASGGALFLINSIQSPDFAQLMGWLLNPLPGFISHNAAIWLAGTNRETRK